MVICQRIKPISISLSPNTERDDIWLAFKSLFFGNIKVGPNIDLLEKQFAQSLGVRFAYSFNSGRSSLMAILRALEFKSGDEILIQAFTCNAVPNPVVWANLKPVYVDCGQDDYNIDIDDLKKKISSKSKALIVQHTFGIPAKIDQIIEVCAKNNLILIEDCAHSFGATYNGKQLGTFGKVSLFSFSRDKMISSVYGGMATTNDEAIAQRLEKYQKEIGYPSVRWVYQQLLHPVFMNLVILPTYSFFGKYLLILFQSLGIFSKAVHWKEKIGERPGYFPKRLPDCLAVLAINQLRKLDRFNRHRSDLAAYYFSALSSSQYELINEKHIKEAAFLRVPVKNSKAHEIIKKAWKCNILIGDWYTSPVAPDDTRLARLQYSPGSCPNAEKLASITLNLPTHINISIKDAQKIVEFLKQHGN